MFLPQLSAEPPGAVDSDRAPRESDSRAVEAAAVAAVAEQGTMLHTQLLSILQYSHVLLLQK